jgi:RNA polymerase sigma factor (sigma-70 family)
LLITTARNHCIDLLRKELRRGVLAWSQLESTDAPAAGDGGDSPPVIDFIADPDSLAAEERRQLKDTVERVLMRLEPVDRFILQRRFYSGWTRAEIAEELECTVQNVGIHERKASRLFQEYFAQEWDCDKLPT